jgi:ribosome-binding protein aMBF1 (putative translation factor)
MYNTQIINREIENQDFTNEKLAVKADLAARTVSSIRNGEENVRLISLKKVAAALGLKLVVKFEKEAA